MNVWNALTGPRPRYYKPKNTSKTPKTRDGQTYPGGRQLRRRLKKLGARINSYEQTVSQVRGKGADAYKKPGAMK